MTKAPLRDGFAPSGPIRLYFEIHGEGRPLVLLHGGVDPGETFGAPLAALAQDRQVIAIHLPGHGRTGASPRAFTYEGMADDVAAVLRHLRIAQADLMGYSLGGGVALQVALRHPGLVGKLVLISAPFAQSGSFPEVQAAFAQMPANAAAIAANLRASPLAERYPAVDWEALFRGLGEMNRAPYDWREDLPKLQAQTLLIFADADSIRPDHMLAFYAALGGGLHDAGLDGARRSKHRLAILPGTTHYTIMRSALTTTLARDFLSTP